jgi:flagellar hook assembly protein FlgD
LFLLTGSALQAQTFGNEWIDYSKTYYKFKVAKEGIYRIPKSSLTAAGIPDFITGNQFALYKDGQEVALYVTTPGAMGASDYIEFYGRGPNGNLDKTLYANPAWHINDSVSLFTDTACYYLTYGVNVYQRYTTVNNAPGGSPLQYVWYTAGKYFKNHTSTGRSYSQTNKVYSAQFDCGEAMTSGFGFVNAPLSVPIATPEVYDNGPNGSMKINMVVKAVGGSDVVTTVALNNQDVVTETISLSPYPATVKRFNVVISPTQLQSNNTVSYTTNYTDGGDNDMGTAQLEIVYPHTNNLAGLSEFRFSLKASPSSNQTLQFTNFDHGGISPRLYDITNRKVYNGDISVPGQTSFYLDPSLTERTLMLANEGGTTNLSSVKSFQFTNYTAAAQQGNYVIITHNQLRQATDGQDYVQKYKEYRSSPEGGGYSVVVADVESLYDQFAYGMETHPLSIKNFLYYAYTNWGTKPEYALLLGKGLVYSQYKNYLQNQSTFAFPLVPTFGDPGSDVDLVNFGTDNKAKVKVGRISAWSGMEIGNYLNKVKNYEEALKDSPTPNKESEFWKKKFVHVAGGSDAALQGTLLTNLANGEKIIKEPFFGAQVTTVTKNTTTPIDQVGSELVNSMIDSGIYALTFHGHAAAGNFDFNLNNPEMYHNQPRLMHLMAFGCDVSQIFSLTTLRTISERYINAPGGAISVIAQDNLGYLTFHGPYIQRFYRSMGLVNYGATLGTHYSKSYDSTLYVNNLLHNANDFTFTQLECLLLMADPALKMVNNQKPDYHVTDDGLSTNPSNVTTTLDSFKLKINTYNLGRAISDTVNLKVEHLNAQGGLNTVAIYPIINLYSQKEVILNIPINKTTDVGLNKYIVSIDNDQQFDENSENNNTASLSIFIFADKLVPVYPQEFAIVGTQDITLKASTLNPFKPVTGYKIQIDTTELFNSPMLTQYNTQSGGGVIKWKPNINYIDGTVYYWRTAVDSGNSAQPEWTNSSFTYISQKWGWNQSHYYQYLKDNFSTLVLPAETRLFDFKLKNNLLSIFNACLNTDGSNPNTVNDVKIMYNDQDLQRSGCAPYSGTIQIMVLDTLTGNPWINPVNGQQGSYPRCFNTRNTYVFEFPVAHYTERRRAAKFLDSIPAGHYIVIKNFLYDPYFNDVSGFAQHWAVDGPPNRLYNTLKDLGFTMLDSFNKRRSFIFVCKKGDANFPVTQIFSQGTTDKIQADIVIPARNDSGILYSKVVGPAKQWETLKWKTTAIDNLPQEDEVYVKVIGITANNTETTLFSTANKDTSIAGINADTYPGMRLEWYSKDTTHHTTSHLDYWRVHYVPIPEAALNPNALLTFKDTLGEGENGELNIAIEELAGRPMDSMLVKYRVIDANGVAHDLQNVRYKKLGGNDTLHAKLSFDASPYPGDNFLFIEANPNNDQVEQFHPNNLGYLPFRVITDNLNPIIDVTFDGIHILDRDIVSAKPFIKIILKDENKYLKLDDTSLLDVSIRYIDDGSSATPVPLDGTTAKFIPAASTDKNEAVVEYKPEFLQDGFYELSVNGKDKKGNSPSTTDYRISFEVINKSTITNVLNYPNPFSTSTAFLFTLTGWQLPSQFKIQILTVSGKVVREITKQELGPVHIGRNISEYKWDGKDQYGQMLGNGVYLYRVVTAINGSDIEHRESGADKFTQKGYGKMYIMR